MYSLLRTSMIHPLPRQTLQTSIGRRRNLSRTTKLRSDLPSPDNVDQGVSQTTDGETSSFAMSLFNGHLNPTQLIPYPDVLNEDQHDTLRMMVDSLTKGFGVVDPLELDTQETIPDNILNSLKEGGCLGLMVPAEYEGIGLCNTQYARVCELSGGYDLGIGIMTGAHQSIGFKGIVLFGNAAQKSKYLPDLASGRKLAAYCLTEPASGSDASSIRSRAVLSPDRSHYVLNGSKIWISNGGIADVMTVMAQTPVTDPKSGKVKDKISAFIVERNFGGVTSGPPEKKMGIKCSNTAEVFFDDVKIPVENRLLEEGDGFKIAMNILNNGRFGMVAALSGTMKTLIARAADHAVNRTQFRDKISEFGAIQEKLARMQISHYVSESMAYALAGTMDLGHKDFQLEAAIGKVFASEAAWFVVDECLQIMGGLGYMKAAGVEKVMRDLRIFRIFEGTNEILRLFVALTGMQHAGIGLRAIRKAVSNPAANLGVVLSASLGLLKDHLGRPRSRLSLASFVDVTLSPEAAAVDQLVQHFGVAVTAILRKYGNSVTDRQFVLMRVADAAIDIYAMATVVSRCDRSLKAATPSCALELDMVRAFVFDAEKRVKENIKATYTDDIQFDRFRDISKAVVERGGIIQNHPIGY